MSEESILILNMLREGKITAEQADSLLRAVRTTAQPSPAPPPPPAPSAPPPAVDPATLAQMQNKLGDLQSKLGDLQGKLGTAQAARAAGHAASLMGKALDHLPKADIDFGRINKTVDEAMRGLNSFKNDALRTAKVAARQAGQEARRAAKQGRKAFDDLGFAVSGEEIDSKRPRNRAGQPEASELLESSVTWSGAHTLVLVNAYGSITVTGTEGDGGAATASLTKTAWAETEAEARVLLQQVFLTSRVEGGKCRVEIIAPDDARDCLTVDYKIRVPRDLPLEIETTFGDIFAEAASAQLIAKAVGGSVTARRPVESHAGEAKFAGRSGIVRLEQWNTPLTGITVETTSGDIYGDALSCRSLSLLSRSGDVMAQKAQTVTDASFESISGDVHISGGSVGGRLQVKTQSGSAVVVDVHAAALAVETVSGDAEVQNAAGTLTIKTVSGDILGQGIESGSAALGTVSGDARWTFATPFSGSLAATTVSGDVSVRLQANSDTRVEMSTTSGDVVSRVTFAEGDTHDTRSVSGTLGTGTGSLKLQSVSGDLTLEPSES